MLLEDRIHKVSQQKIDQRFGSGYPPMIVSYFRGVPVKMGPDNRPTEPIEPHPGLLEAARQLGQVADFLIVSANGPHIFQDQLEQASGLKMLSMIDLAIGEAQKRGWRRMGLLGLGTPRVYIDPLSEMNVEHLILEQALMDRLSAAIFSVMEGHNGPAESAVAQEAVNDLFARGADGIILGCTELPILLAGDLPNVKLVDTLALTAEAAVNRALAD